MRSSPFLGCEYVTKSFGSPDAVPALLDVTFSIDEGQQLCITGASGSGKTTLLTILGGLQRPTSGDVRIREKSLLGMTPKDLAALRARDIGFIFQSAALIPVLSARENIDYPLRIAKPVDDVLELTNLRVQQNLRPGALSGGECQRVAIARAVVKRPSLILADEPTSHLDDNNTVAISSIFQHLQDSQNSTIIIATHDGRLLATTKQVLLLKFWGESLNERHRDYVAEVMK
jgi:putative ABC transport system ATP-binding protein